MKTEVLRKVGRYALWLSPVVILVGVRVVTKPWLEQQNDTVILALNALMSMLVMGYCVVVGGRMQGRLDEVEIANQGFAVRHGWTWGLLAAGALLTLPPVRNWLIDLANTLSTGSPNMSDRDAMLLALFFSFLLVVLTQLVAVIVASAVWQRRMRGI